MTPLANGLGADSVITYTIGSLMLSSARSTVPIPIVSACKQFRNCTRSRRRVGARSSQVANCEKWLRLRVARSLAHLLSEWNNSSTRPSLHCSNIVKSGHASSVGHHASRYSRRTTDGWSTTSRPTVSSWRHLHTMPAASSMEISEQHWVHSIHRMSPSSPFESPQTSGLNIFRIAPVTSSLNLNNGW